MRPISTAIATLLIGSLASLAHAWAPARDAARTTAQPMKGHEASSVAQQEQPKHPRETPEAKPPAAEETKPPNAEKEPQKKEQPKQEKQEQKQQKQTREQRSASKQPEHARPAGKSAHIPDDQFKAHFGRPHTFPVKRVITTTTVIPNQTQFFYSGYTFIFLDPWPTEWLPADDCFIDYIDGEYFLFDVLHPGIRVALFVAE
jgi:hypothetical protein